MRWCSKSGCPARLSMPGGQEKGRYYLCPHCGDSVQVIPFPLKWIVGLVLLLLSLVGIEYLEIGKWLESRARPPGETEIIPVFVEALNQKDFEKAYALSRNERWEPYERFVSVVWADMVGVELKSQQKKIRPSKFGAEAVYAVEYEVRTREGQRTTFLYDFHLQRFDDQWKILRLTEPIAHFYAPELTLKARDYTDKSAEDILLAFFKELSDQGNRRLRRAHFFTMNFSWGNDYREFERQSIWQPVRYAHPYSIRPVLGYDGKWGQEAYVVDYIALGRAGEGTYEARYVMHMDRFEGMWKIAKMTELSGELEALPGEMQRLPSRALAVLEGMVNTGGEALEVVAFKREFFALKRRLGARQDWEERVCCILAKRYAYPLQLLDTLEESVDRYLEECSVAL